MHLANADKQSLQMLHWQIPHPHQDSFHFLPDYHKQHLLFLDNCVLLLTALLSMPLLKGNKKNPSQESYKFWYILFQISSEMTFRVWSWISSLRVPETEWKAHQTYQDMLKPIHFPLQTLHEFRLKSSLFQLFSLLFLFQSQVYSKPHPHHE